MGKVLFNMSMSLDGFVAGSNDEVDHVFQWYNSGDTAVPLASSDMVFHVSSASAALFAEVWPNMGALVCGRRLFDFTNGWNGKHPFDVPVFVLTHEPPHDWADKQAPFTFVTDGVASAIAQAKAAAGDKYVAISTATVFQQAFCAGLVDEIHIDLAPVLLCAGVRLFERLGTEPHKLEQIHALQGTGVTHLRYRVVK